MQKLECLRAVVAGCWKSTNYFGNHKNYQTVAEVPLVLVAAKPQPPYEPERGLVQMKSQT
jgi:hypothetical protein